MKIYKYVLVWLKYIIFMIDYSSITVQGQKHEIIQLNTYTITLLRCPQT